MTENNVPKVYAALVRAQAKFPAIGKESTGQLGNRRYQYAPLEAIIDAVRPALNEENLAFYWSGTSDGITCFLVSAEDGSSVSSTYAFPVGQTDGNVHQQHGSARTYGKRYTLTDVTGAQPGGEDDDAASAPAGKQNGSAVAKPAARATSPDPTQQAPAGSIGAALTDPQAVAAKVANCLSLVARSREHAVAAGFADERKNAISSIMASKYIFTAPQGGPPTGIARTDNQPMTLADCMALEVQFSQVAKKYAEMASRATDGAP